MENSKQTTQSMNTYNTMFTFIRSVTHTPPHITVNTDPNIIAKNPDALDDHLTEPE